MNHGHSPPLRAGAIWVLVAAVLCSPGTLLAHRGVDQQIADLSVRIAREPGQAELYLRRADLHRIHRDWELARKDLTAARKKDPQLVEVDYLLATLKLDAGRPAEALRAANRFLSARPDHAMGHVQRGRARVALGKYLPAAEDFDRALALAGAGHSTPTMYIERAHALAAAGNDNLERALSGLEQGLVELQGPITLELLAIDLELRAGKTDAALVRIERLADASPRRETWDLRRGEILEADGRPDQARTAYAEALAAIEALPPARRHNRAMQRIETAAREALNRLPPPVDED